MPAAAIAEYMKTSTPEQQKKSMEDWKTWSKSHSEIVDMGAPLGKNMRITKEGAAPMSNEVGGYSFIEAESAEKAAEIFKDCPHFVMPGAYIELMPCLQM